MLTADTAGLACGFMARERKKDTDFEALQSELKRIPNLDIATVRDLLDVGITRIDELSGRAPEAILDTIKAKKPGTPQDRLQSIRLAVYFAETPEPDRTLLHPWKWA